MLKQAFTYLKTFFKRADMLLFSLALVSAIFGIVVISSATASDPSSSYVIVQSVSLLLGIGLFVLLTVIDIDIIADKWMVLVGVSVLLVLALIPFGVDDGTGNKAWIRFFGIGIQPSEVVKVLFIIVFAKHTSSFRENRKLNSPLSVLQLTANFFFFFGLIIVISSDLGSALVYLFIFFIILFASGVKFYWFAIGIGALAAATPLIWTHLLKPYQRDRILAPYVPGIDPDGFGIRWQANQSKLAMASGQLTGTGLYNGLQAQSNALPAKHTDFIFGVIGEELGMIGCLAVILLLTAIIIRCVYVGVKSKNTMNMLVCFGVAATFFFQTFENIGMCMGIAPVIGITLPLFSYGGSSLFCMFAALGLVSGIRYRPKPERFRSYG